MFPNSKSQNVIKKKLIICKSVTFSETSSPKYDQHIFTDIIKSLILYQMYYKLLLR